MLNKFLTSLFLTSVLIIFGYTSVSAQAYGTHSCSWSGAATGCVPAGTTGCTNGGAANASACSSYGTAALCEPAAGPLTINCIAPPAPPPPPADTVETVGKWYNRDFFEWHDIVYNADNETEIFGERYTAAQVEWIIWGTFAWFLNNFVESSVRDCIFANRADTSGTAIGDCLAENQSFVDKLQTIINFLRADVTNPNTEKAPMLASVFAAREFSGIQYIREKLNIVPEAKAQGFGFQELGFLRNLWRISRDVSFSLMVFVIIAMAIMIMFRMKISPQAAISVQYAIPKIFITVFLIAFSYAIAGFMVDLVYVVIAIFAVALDSISPVVDSATYYDWMISGIHLGPVGGGIGSLLSIFIAFFALVFMMSIMSMLGWFSVIVPAISAGFASIVALIAMIIIWIVCIFLMFRILWALVKALVGVYISIITAPFQILMGALVPGTGFGPWLKGLAANLLVFPLTGGMFFLSYIFLAQSAIASFEGSAIVQLVRDFFDELGVGTGAVGFWEPPLLASGNGMAGMILSFVALAILFAIPKIADIIKGAMTGRPYAFGSAIGEAMGPVGGGAGLYGGYAGYQMSKGSLPWPLNRGAAARWYTGLPESGSILSKETFRDVGTRMFNRRK